MNTPVTVEVDFPAPQLIYRVVAWTPSAHGAGSGTTTGVRDYQLQVRINGAWQTVKSGMRNVRERVLTAPVNAQISGVRLVITAINNGRFWDDQANYTGSYQSDGITPNYIYSSCQRAMVYELEAYGPYQSPTETVDEIEYPHH